MRIGVSVRHTMNLGNYESVTPTVSVEDDVGKGETPVQAFDRVADMAHKLWTREFKKELDEHEAARKFVDKQTK